MRRTFFVWAMPALLLASGGNTVAAEAEADAQGLEEVVVTATKRAERLIDVPASIQALNAQDLQRQGADVFSDYARSLAGVTFTDRGAGNTQFAIRGVTGGVDLDVGPESTVGVYIDEVPISEGMAQPDLKIVDIERVELLRGPQGTLYGSGSLGGTLRIITPKPNLSEYSGAVRTTFSDTHSGGTNFGADVLANLPLVDGRAGLRLSGYYRNNDGFVDNVGTGKKNVNDEDTRGGRAQLSVKMSDAWMADASVIAQRSDYGSLNGFDKTLGDLNINLVYNEPYHDDLTIGNVTLTRSGGWANFVSSSSYIDRDRNYFKDASAFFGAPGFGDYEYGTRSFAQELRLSSPDDKAKLQWVAGLYYSHTKQTFDQDLQIPGIGTIPGYPEDVVFIAMADTTTKQSAAFADVSYEFAPRWRGELGVRVAHPKLATDRVNLNPEPLPSSASRSSTKVLPKANLSFKPSEDSTVYAQLAKGYRIGGGNIPVPPAPGLPDAPTSFAPDELWNYEIGAKSSMMDGRLALSAAVFYIDWKNVPVQVNRLDGYSWFDNAGDATSKGVEFEATVTPIETLRFQVEATYLDSEIDKVAPGSNATPGERLPAVARWSGSASAQLTIPWSGGVVQYIRIGEQYVGGSRTDFGAFALPMGDYWLASVRTGVTWNQWDADLFVSNATDKRATLYVNQFGGPPRFETNRPRTIGLTLRYAF